MEPEKLTFRKVNQDILATLGRPGKGYLALLALALGLIVLWWVAEYFQLNRGLGVAGYAHPVFWAFDITNFVFWVGIAHSGTLISAILFLFRAKWRVSVYRSAEAMTVFAIMTAGLFPIIHMGRAWFFYWLFPYPSQRLIWPNFRSPLIWDVFAISTYFTVSAMFFFLGLLPDIAACRDRFADWRRRIYAFLSLGWQGTTRQWKHYGAAYLFFAGLATPLVVSVHSVVSWDFAMSIVPGWHSTIFAPYFVAGAIFSGSAMVLTLLILFRKAFKLEAYITNQHFENLAKVVLLTSLIVSYSYLTEFFIVHYNHNAVEDAGFAFRAGGHYALLFWIMLTCNSVIPLSLFFPRVRRSIPALFAISLAINLGMWMERFVIIVTSLAHEFMPYAYGIYHPTWVDYSLTAGSFGWFFFLFLSFVRLFPAVSLTEVKEHLGHSGGEAG